MAYQRFAGEGWPESFGSYETFFLRSCEQDDADGVPMASGWYWQACFPGCLPDGDASGPFATEAEAIEDANNQ